MEPLLYRNGITARPIEPRVRSRFDDFLAEPTPRIRGRLEKDGNKTIFKPAGLVDLLRLTPGYFKVEQA